TPPAARRPTVRTTDARARSLLRDHARAQRLGPAPERGLPGDAAHQGRPGAAPRSGGSIQAARRADHAIAARRAARRAPARAIPPRARPRLRLLARARRGRALA